MRVRSALLALTLIPTAAFAVAAHTPENCSVYDAAADGTADDILLCTEAYYLSCADTLDPAGKIHDFYRVPVVKMTADAPTTSFTEGAGCGYPQQNLLTNVNQGSFATFDFGGIVTTNIDTVTVEIHDLGPLQTAFNAADDDGTVGLTARLTIDGKSPFGMQARSGATGTEFFVPATLDIPLVAEVSDTGASTRFVFSVVNIGADLPELLKPFGDHDPVFHDVKLTFDMPDTEVPDNPAILGAPSHNLAPVWGAVEVPAGITINGEVRGTVIDASEVG